MVDQENGPVEAHVDVEIMENLVRSSVQSVEADNVTASMSAIASSRSTTLDATASAIALARVDGDVSIRLSSAPLVYTKGDLSFHQSYGSAFVAGQNVSIRQGATAFSVAKTISFDQAGTGVAVATDVNVNKGFVGLLLARNAQLSDETRVLVSGRNALYIVGALLGGFALVALAIVATGTAAVVQRTSGRRHAG